MSDIKATRLSKIARELNVGISTIVDFLHKKGVKINSSPNEKIAPELYDMLLKEFSTDLNVKKESEKLILRTKRERLEAISLGNNIEESAERDIQDFEDEVLIKDLRVSGAHTEDETEKQTEKEKIQLNVLGKIDFDKYVADKKKALKRMKQQNLRLMRKRSLR